MSATFLWGAVPSILAALLISSLLAAPPATIFGPRVGMMAGTLIIAPVVEESIKGLAPLLGWLAAVFVHFVHNLTAYLGGSL